MASSDRDLLLQVKVALDALNEKLDVKISNLREEVARHDRSLYGNGQPGISKRLDVLENTQQNCPARASAGEEGRANKRMFVVSMGMLLIAVGSLLLSYLKG